MDLETDASPAALDSVFRALHTLKGGGAMSGFPALSAFAHHFEDAFDLVREGRIGVSRASGRGADRARPYDCPAGCGRG
ncbi:Hpt domain-containing protein [Rhodobacter sp. Har01]|uniref:Hpt domain-containing protein n=1 Tax=Rhodobacter sp. Har01 TaxID=2883999 RepID=UPI001D06A1E5|nr:Hpt domain-containing protein [Rhodobacter sp. Har01]